MGREARARDRVISDAETLTVFQQIADYLTRADRSLAHVHLWMLTDAPDHAERPHLDSAVEIIDGLRKVFANQCARLERGIDQEK